MSLLSSNLKAFLSIVRHGTVHGAAKELYLSQTGVTQRLRSIEKELGTTLFLRSRKGMKLTLEGETLFRYCTATLELESQTLNQISNLNKDAPISLTLAGPTSVISSRISDQCMNLFSVYPNMNLNLMISDLQDGINLVKSGSAALAIVPPELVPNEMDSKLLKPEKYLLVASSKWKGRRIFEILENERIIDFDENDQTTFNYLKKFDLIKKIKSPRLFANNNEVLIKYFTNGVGYGTLTQEIAKPHIESGNLITLNGGAAMENSLGLVWYPRPQMPEYFKAILKALR